LPITKRPFKEIAEELNSDEEEIINRLIFLKNNGYIRRMGAFFDSDKLGYKGTLIALKVREDKIKEVANAINKYNGVTHNYEREGRFNLWFTLLSPTFEYEENFIKTVQKMDGVEDMLNLKANHKYKINVAFKLR